TIEKVARAAEPQRRPERGAVNMDWGFEGEGAEEEEGVAHETEAEGASEDGEGRRSRRRRRRRGRRGDRPEGESPSHHPAVARSEFPGRGDQRDCGANGNDDEADEEGTPEPAADLEEGDDRGQPLEGAGENGVERRARRGRRRGRRGGRRDREH